MLLLWIDDMDAEELVLGSVALDLSSLSSVTQRRSLANEKMGTLCVEANMQSCSSILEMSPGINLICNDYSGNITRYNFNL